MIIYFNGEWLEEAKVRIAPTDRGLLLGDGCFETLAVSDGKVEWLERHLDRFYATADELKIWVPQGREKLCKALQVFPDKATIANGRMRLTLTRGVQIGEGRGGGLPGWEDKFQPTLFASLVPHAKAVPKKNEDVKLWVSERRVSSTSFSVGLKSTSYLDRLHAREMALQQGADDALLTNEWGHIVECGMSNVFWIKDDKIYTPWVQSGCLPGVIRGVILDITEVNKLELHVGAYALDCLYNADSIFLTNSIIGLRYVHKVNGKVFSTENDTYEELFSKYIVELKKSGNK